MNVGDTPREVIVDSPNMWNDAGIVVARGEEYEIYVRPDQKWFDKGIENTPDGTPSQNLIMRLFEGRRRKPDALWFALIAAIGQSDKPDSMTVIGGGTKTFRPQMDGELYFFANDHRRYYDNNEGSITLTVKRTR